MKPPFKIGDRVIVVDTGGYLSEALTVSRIEPALRGWGFAIDVEEIPNVDIHSHPLWFAERFRLAEVEVEDTRDYLETITGGP